MTIRSRIDDVINTPTHTLSPLSIDKWEEKIQQINMVSNNMRIDKLDEYQVGFDSFNNNVN